MDPRVMKAGVAMALGMTLLIPTFNAINNSYIIPDEIPPWMPSQLPENFQPPTNPPTPPPDWQPPPDWKPPEGWEDWEPPPDWEGKMEGYPPPPGDCPPPVVKRPESANTNLTIPRQNADWSRALTFNVPQYTLGVAVWTNYTDWIASEVRSSIASPNGAAFGEEQSAEGATGTFGIGQSATARTSFEFKWDPRERNNELPEPGAYTINLAADAPGGIGNNMQGSIRVETYLVLPCGGAFQ